jgi:hypothetical protein
VDLRSSEDLEEASRGEGERSGDPPGTCYFLHDGEYRQGKELLLFVRRGGSPESPRRFVGESRSGVVLRGRATIDDGVSHVLLANMTFDLTGYFQDGSFNTVTLGRASDVTLDRLTLTGDCRTGRRGGHVETDGTEGVRILSCLIERFGRCGSSDGHEDHGIYLASGSDIEIRDSAIRGNASRGIQLYTAGGAYGTLARIRILRNRIYGNGHRNYEDGIVIAGTDRGTIEDVIISGNLIFDNYYSGIRFAGAATRGILVRGNTFFRNGARSNHDSRSEINSEGRGSAAGALVERNIFSVANRLINNCYDASGRGFSIRNNVVDGRVAPWFRGGCVSDTIDVDPDFVDADAADFRPREPAAVGYGAYAWKR